MASMKLNLTRRRLGAGVATLGLAAAAVAGTGIVSSSNAANAPGAAFSAIVLGVGETETSRTLAWYSSTNPTGGEEVQLATKPDFSDKTAVTAALTNNATTDPSNGGAALTNANGKAVLSSLKPNTTYYYRVAETGTANYSQAYSFKTGTFGNGDFQFLFFGDPQIGSTGDPVKDGAGWEFAMDQTDKYSPKAELYVSGGDQVNTANNEAEWNNFLLPDQLRSKPWAATIGNHDNGGRAYDQHFALPGTKDNSNALYSNNNNTGSATGGDYWYKYKGVLFIDLNSNAYSATNGSDPAHVAFVTKTIAEHKGDAKHVVLVYHHAIYSPAAHANDGDAIQRRTDFTKAFSDAGVDLVLQGHDHAYSRSYALKGTALGQVPAKADANEQPGQGTVVAKEGGVIYVTANSASGSKYYELSEPDVTKGGNGPDTVIGGPQSVKPAAPTETHVRHWANSVESQEYLQQYVQITVNDKGLQVKNIRANDGTGPNPEVDKANAAAAGSAHFGPTLQDWSFPIGSIQDQVDIFRSKDDISPIVPPADVVKVDVPGPTVEVTKTVSVPGPTVTVSAAPAPAVTVTAQPLPAPTVTVTATTTNTVVVEKQVEKKIDQLTKKIKHAKGDRKANLKAQLAAYKSIQSQF